MTNWYKKSDISTFVDRNDLNKRITEFKNMIVILEYLSKYVYQNATHARRVLKMLRDDKKTSSYPHIKEILNRAFIKSLDNYKECSLLCKNAVDEFVMVLEKMEMDRQDFTEERYPKIIKERVNNAKKE